MQPGQRIQKDAFLGMVMTVGTMVMMMMLVIVMTTPMMVMMFDDDEHDPIMMVTVRKTVDAR